MCDSIKNGINSRGVLPGGIGILRKARSLFHKNKMLDVNFKNEALLTAYAYSVSEENACAGKIVAAPTCGSSGVLPAVLYHIKKISEHSDTDIIHSIATAGLLGNIVKHNGSISGAMVGCQGEIGTACAMAAAAATESYTEVH